MSIVAPLGRYQFVQELAIGNKLPCPLGATFESLFDDN